MQKRKPEIEEKIKESARVEFLARGFEGALVADIASNAGISVGNFYRYYENKLALLDDVVGGVFQYIPRFIYDMASTITVMDMPLEQFSSYMAKEMHRVFWKNKRELDILLYKCDGTRYARFRNIIERLIRTIVTRRNFGKRTPTESEKLFAKVVAAGYFQGLLEILKKDFTGDEFIDPVRKLTQFFFNKISA